MNIFQFLRIFQRHIFLLIAVPIILAAIVKYLTRNPSLEYESSTTIFTGIASGYDLDQNRRFNMFANNTAFDNLIELIKSREVATEVSLRLFTQNLMLDKYDPNYISRKSFISLQRYTPAYIKALIIKDTVASTKKSATEDQDATKNQNFLKRDSILIEHGAILKTGALYHSVNDNESLYEISVNYGVPISELMNNNNLTDYNVEVGSELFLSYASTNPAEINDPNFIGKDTVNAEYAQINRRDFEKSLQRIMKYTYANDTNWIYRLLNSSNPHYSINNISKATVQRIKSSDLITLKYKSNDPGITYQTLIHLTSVFIKSKKNINENQSDAVVKYFQGEVDRASGRLTAAEDRLLNFNKSNNIINYYEQSKAIAVTKEDLDIMYQREQIRFQAARAVITTLEDQLELQDRVQLKTMEILRNRNALSEVTSKIAIADLYGDTDPKNIETLNKLKEEAAKLKNNLKLYVHEYFTYTQTKDGIQTESLLAKWLDNVIVFEESKASLQVLNNRIREFQEYYKMFAPLGATQKRIEREINVSEREYLSLLHSLNLSKLKQQNIELSSNIKAVDPPYFPLKPLPVNTAILVIVAAFMGFAMVAFVIIALEYLDNTIRNPERFADLTRLKVISAFPKLLSKYQDYNMPFITGRLIEIAVQDIKSQAEQKGEYPYLICFISTLAHEGKTELAQRMAGRLRFFGERVLFLKRAIPERFNSILEGTDPDELRAREKTREFEKHQSKKNQLIRGLPIIGNFYNNMFKPNPIEPYQPHQDDVYFQQDDHFFDIKGLNQLNLSREIDYSSYSYIFIEMPGIIFNPYPVSLIKSANMHVLVARANRNWKKADINALNSYMKNTKERPLGLLNGVEIELLETILGELPKKRSWFRRKLKTIISLQYKARYEIK